MKKPKKQKKIDTPKKPRKESAKKKGCPKVKEKTKKNVASQIDTFKNSMSEIVAKYQLIENLPRFYGGHLPLYFSEIRALHIIGDTPGINLTKIAENLKVSKSAVSKSTGKLLEKGLISKERSLREVLFNLTDLGQEAYDRMDKEESRLFNGPRAAWNALDPKDQTTVSNFLATLSQSLDGSVNILREPLGNIDEQ